MPDPLDPPAPGGGGADPLNPGSSAAAAAAASLTDSATRKRPGSASDGAGGQTTIWADSGPYACLLTARSVQYSEQEKAGTTQAVTSWLAAFQVGTDILPKDRLVINGQLLEVIETDAGASNAVLLTAQCVRVR